MVALQPIADADFGPYVSGRQKLNLARLERLEFVRRLHRYKKTYGNTRL